jgi:hypothetical protein
MDGKTIWEIGRVLSGPYTEETQKMHDTYPDFIAKWGSRCKTIYKAVPERFKNQVPDDIAAAREISKFKTNPNVGLAKLIKAFEKGLITNRSTRSEIDNLYTSLGGGPVADRHPE